MVGPLYGVVAGRLPHRRLTLVASAALLQAAAWSAVLLWPGTAPFAVLVGLAALLGVGGPSSLVAFDVARAAVAPSLVGRASGAVNVGGFVSTVLVVLLVGLALDLQGAGDPSAWSPAAFRVAMLVQVPVWLAGLTAVAVAARSARRAVGTRCDEPADGGEQT